MKIWAGASVVGLLAVVGSYHLGKVEGRRNAATSALETSVQVLRERGKIDAQVNASDAGALCDDLGLLSDELSECMRRLAEAQPEP
ncbi:hypothetical protein [Limoniibacter endophyticus]|uniref:hypothetical protein n=1 Tax=Limoniibacter endophyticus TaxID=1565040 RepID=UPI00167B44DD